MRVISQGRGVSEVGMGIHLRGKHSCAWFKCCTSGSCWYAVCWWLHFTAWSCLVCPSLPCPAQVILWLVLLGEVLVFGPLLLKSWRVYRIYHHPSVNGKVWAEGRGDTADGL